MQIQLRCPAMPENSIAFAAYIPIQTELRRGNWRTGNIASHPVRCIYMTIDIIDHSIGKGASTTADSELDAILKPRLEYAQFTSP